MSRKARKSNAQLDRVISFFACATILVPIHPSLQDFISVTGIPAVLILTFCFVPVLLGFFAKATFKSHELRQFLVLLAFILWTLISALVSFTAYPSDALSVMSSLRGVVFLMPLAAACAFVAARDLAFAGKTICALALVAVIHLTINLILDEASSVSGLVSLLKDSETGNYQATSFYFGLFAVAMFALLYGPSPATRLIAFGALVTVIALMGLVGARSSLVAIGASVTITLICNPSVRVVITLAVGSVAIVGVMLASELAGLIDMERISDTFIVLDRFMVLTEGDDSSMREMLFSSAIAMWSTSALHFLFGGGLGSFPAYIGMPPEEGWYPHNFTLEILAEMGLVGAVIVAPIGLRLIQKFVLLRFIKLGFTRIYTGMLAVYVLSAYQFMGGIQDLWIPTFFVGLFLFGLNKSRNDNQRI